MAIDIEELQPVPADPVRESRTAIVHAREQMDAVRGRIKKAAVALIDTSLETARSGRSVSSDKLQAVRPPAPPAEPESDLTARFKALREPL